MDDPYLAIWPHGPHWKIKRGAAVSVGPVAHILEEVEHALRCEDAWDAAVRVTQMQNALNKALRERNEAQREVHELRLYLTAAFGTAFPSITTPQAPEVTAGGITLPHE